MNQTRAKRGNVIAGLLMFSVIVLGIFLLFWDGFIIRLNTADYIQIAIFIALVWYSIETHLLRMWQKKQAQIIKIGSGAFSFGFILRMFADFSAKVQ